MYHIVPELRPFFTDCDDSQFLVALCGCEYDFARDFIRDNIYYIDYRGWKNLALNKADWAGQILRERPNKIRWDYMSMNEAEWKTKNIYQ